MNKQLRHVICGNPRCKNSFTTSHPQKKYCCQECKLTMAYIMSAQRNAEYRGKTLRNDYIPRIGKIQNRVKKRPSTLMQDHLKAIAAGVSYGKYMGERVHVAKSDSVTRCGAEKLERRKGA